MYKIICSILPRPLSDIVALFVYVAMIVLIYAFSSVGQKGFIYLDL